MGFYGGQNGGYDPVGFFTEGEVALPETGTFLTWVEFTDSADVTNVWSMQALVDPSTYFGGFKEPRVIEMGTLVRALSDINGTYQGADFQLVLSDNDRLVRGKLKASSTKFFLNRSLVVRMIDDVSRREGLTPRTIMRGLVADYRPLPDLKFSLGAQDVITRRFSSQIASQSQVPKRTITLDDFPEAPPETVGKPVPIIYGVVSDENEQSVIVGTQPKFVATGNMSYTNHGTAGTWNVTYVVTLVGDETAYPPWAGENQQDERVIGTLVIPNCIGPNEFVQGSRYTTIEWDQPFGFATKIYGRFKDGNSFKGGTFGYMAYVPKYITEGVLATDRVIFLEGWFNSSQDQFQPPTNNMYVSGTFSAGNTVLVDNARGVIQPIYVGPKRFK